MSAPAELPLCTVFEGSSPEDVSHARVLWSSLSLLPPQESRLVSADTGQRLPVSRPQPSSSTTGPKRSASLQPHPSFEHALLQRLEERRRYAAMADQRMETMALLRRQRERRVRRELLSVGELLSGGRKPRLEPGGEKRSKLRNPADSEMDEEELVKQLQ